MFVNHVHFACTIVIDIGMSFILHQFAAHIVLFIEMSEDLFHTRVEMYVDEIILEYVLNI